MSWDVAGLGNALMDALVVMEDDRLLTELGLTRGTMHPVDHAQWQSVYERVKHLDVIFDSGGSCANTIATVGRLGGKAVYCGHVGEDQMGHMYAAHITEACGQHRLAFSNSQHTGKCLSIISAEDAERTMLTDLGAAIAMPNLGAFSQDILQSRVAHFTGYTLLPGPMQEVALKAIRTAAAAGVQVSIDAADPFVVAAIRDLLWQVLTDHTDIVFLNADEARQLTDLEPEHAAAHIGDRAGVKTVVVKLGSRGSLVWHQGDLHEVGIRRVDAVDTTGAGDAYAGGYLFAHARGWSPDLCAALGSHVAGLTVAQVGAVVKDRTALSDAIALVGSSAS